MGLALLSSAALRTSSAATAGVLLAAALLPVMPVIAGQYEALCSGTKCTVVVSPTEIASPFGSIPAKRVTYWGNTGDSKTSVGTSVTLFGGIGLLGSLAKNQQYIFTINGFDAAGKSVSMSFEFKNDKPAKRLMQEMVEVTGLGMGQTRTVEEIRAAERGVPETPGAMPQQSSGSGTSSFGALNGDKPQKIEKN